MLLFLRRAFFASVDFVATRGAATFNDARLCHWTDVVFLLLSLCLSPFFYRPAPPPAIALLLPPSTSLPSPIRLIDR